MNFALRFASSNVTMAILQ